MIVKLIAIVAIVAGVVYFLKPAIMRKCVDFWTKDKSHLYGGSALSLVIGIILMKSASGCSMPWFITLVGIAAIIKGIIGFVAGEKKVAAFAEKIKNKKDKNLRNFAILPIVIGILLVYAA